MTNIRRPMTHIRRTAGAAALGACVALALTACGSSTSASSTATRTSSAAASARPPATTARQSNPAAASGHVKVSISNYAFAPATITVRVGTRVTFTNHDQTAHTGTANGSAFERVTTMRSA